MVTDIRGNTPLPVKSAVQRAMTDVKDFVRGAKSQAASSWYAETWSRSSSLPTGRAGATVRLAARRTRVNFKVPSLVQLHKKIISYL